MVNKRAALVTGGGKGIGAAIVRGLAADGFGVVIVYRSSQAAAERAAARIVAEGGQALAVRADVRDPAGVAALKAATDRWGRIDTIVNNAGVSKTGLFQDTTDAEYDEIMDVNVRGVFHVTRAYLPNMISRKFGRIVNISSVWGVTGGSVETIYSASKAAVIGLTKALAKEVGPSGITVNAIAPGAIETDMLGNLSAADKKALTEEIPLGRLGAAAEVAQAVRFLVQETTYITGAVLNVNGGMVI